MDYKRKGDKTRYSFLNARCIGRTCWAPGMFQHRAPTGRGSMNTSSPNSPCCMTRAYHGCPSGPDGERTAPCTECAGAGTTANGEQCIVCEGHKQIHHIGLRVFDPVKKAERAKEGWKVA